MIYFLDQNISFRILQTIESHFPESTQVRLEGLENSLDKEIWEYARDSGYLILSFDSDFYEFPVIKHISGRSQTVA